MMMKYLTFLGGRSLLVGLLLSTHFSKASTIDELTAQALMHNSELRFYEAEVTAMKGVRTQAGLWKNPEISIEYGERRIKNSGDQLQNQGTTRGGSFKQTFEFPGKGSLRKAIADQDILIADLALQQFKRTLTGKIHLLALNYLSASQQTQAIEEVSERSLALLQLLQSRPLAGTQQLLELRVIEGSVLSLQQSAKEWIQSREESRFELNSLLGLPPSHLLKIEASLSAPPPSLSTINEIVLAGLSHNLLLKIRTNELEKSTKILSSTKLDVAPDFSVGPFFSQDKAGGSETNFGGTLSLTLPLWNWNQGNIAQSKALQQQADALLLDSRRKVEAQIARTYRSLQVNQKLLELTPETTISNLRSASDLADRQYRTGAITVPLYLEVQREFLNALKIRHEVFLQVWSNQLDLDLLTNGVISEKRIPIAQEKR